MDEKLVLTNPYEALPRRRSQQAEHGERLHGGIGSRRAIGLRYDRTRELKTTANPHA